jgi:hypothetical protein
MKSLIIKALSEHDKREGILFTSEEDAQAYWKETVEIIEEAFLSHIDSVAKKYPAMTYSMIKELKDI